VEVVADDVDAAELQQLGPIATPSAHFHNLNTHTHTYVPSDYVIATTTHIQTRINAPARSA
jgi:hypothetical protein